MQALEINKERTKRKEDEVNYLRTKVKWMTDSYVFQRCSINIPFHVENTAQKE
jgi:hypothetical protein